MFRTPSAVTRLEGRTSDRTNYDRKSAWSLNLQLTRMLLYEVEDYWLRSDRTAWSGSVDSCRQQAFNFLLKVEKFKDFELFRERVNQIQL